MYSETPRAPDEGRFHALWRRENPTVDGQPYEFLNTSGRGHVVGAVLQAQGTTPANTRFFEGDDVAWIDGELTHAVIKQPRFVGSAESVSEAAPLSAEEFEIAAAAISRFEGRLLYARIDVVHATDGKLLISELELMEPSLYLLQSPLALRRFVRAVARMCRAG